MPTPTRRKRRLGAFIRALRERARMSVEDVSALIDKSDSTVRRYQDGNLMPSRLELRTMLAAFKASDEEMAEALERLEDAKQDNIRIEVPSGLPPRFRSFLRAEAEAERSQTISSTVIDGLLQTPEYARAVQESPNRLRATAVPTDRVLDVRLGRQRRLREPDPLAVHAVLDESVVHREVGGPEVMVGQLRHLLELSTLDNVTIQVLSFGAGAYGTMSGGLSILEFAEPDTPAVYLEYPAGGAWVENSDDVGRFTAMFSGVASAALSTVETSALIEVQLSKLEGR